MPDQPSLLQAMPSKREKRDKSWKEDKNTANKKKRAAANDSEVPPLPSPPPTCRKSLSTYMLCSVGAADVPSGEEPMRDINPADAASASPLGELPQVVQVYRVFSFALSCLL